MEKIKVLVIKDTEGQLYHLRMDKPFERPLSKLMVGLAHGDSPESPRSLASVWLELLTEDEYQEIDKAVLSPSIPHFVTTEET